MACHILFTKQSIDDVTNHLESELNDMSEILFECPTNLRTIFLKSLQFLILRTV